MSRGRDHNPAANAVISQIALSRWCDPRLQVAVGTGQIQALPGQRLGRFVRREPQLIEPE